MRISLDGKARLTAILVLTLASGTACSGGRGAASLPPLSSHTSALTTHAPGAQTRRTASVALPSNDAATIPAHVKTWAYWGQSGEPAGITAAYVAAHTTFLSADKWHIAPYKSAGGTFGVAYADPNRIVTSGTNPEPMFNTPEAGWFHDSSGARIFKNYGSWGIQNQTNPTSSIVQTEFNQLTASIAASAPFDFIEVDDVSWDTLNAFYGFSAPGVEISGNAAYQAGEAALLQASTIPVLFNGMSNTDGGYAIPGISGDTVYLPYAAGGIDNEGCLQNVDAIPDTEWALHENTLLYSTNAKKWTICWGISNVSGNASVPRLFFAASWWLTYDPQWSVAFPNFASTGGNYFVFPEYDIVPTQPLKTAVANVSELKDAGGAYLREFAQCYQAALPIGPCATVVNPSQSAAAVLPAHAANYTKFLLLDGNNAFSGGQASWGAVALPASLAPHTALILSGALATPTPTPTPTPAPTASPTPTPAPTPTAPPQLSLSGTVSQIVSGTEFVIKDSACGYEPIFYSSSTAITSYAQLAVGTAVTLTGTGNCSTSVTASALVLGTAPTPSPTPSPAPTPPPTPAPTPSPQLTLSGTISSVVSGNEIVLSGTACGFEPVFYSSSTALSANGWSLAVGTPATVSGTGNCSTSVSASSIVLGSGQTLTKQKGLISSFSGSSFLLNAPDPCGYVYVDYTATTAIVKNGLAFAPGTYATISATGSCSNRFAAVSISLSAT